MEEALLYPSQNIRLFQELLTCGTNIYLWTYDGEGNLLKSNCEELTLDMVLTFTGCKDYMLHYAAENGQGRCAPVILSAGVGMVWCAVYEYQDDELYRIRVIGPVLNNELSVTSIEEEIRRYEKLPIWGKSWGTVFRELLQNLPVVFYPMFFQYAVMLHYCVSGEKISPSDLHFQEIGQASKTPQLKPRDRHQTYMTEQALLRNVREGDLDYKGDLERAGKISRGVQISTGAPMMQAIVSEAVFISLCSRAAIEGGLSPELAYALGDSYIQSVVASKSIGELHGIGHAMYEDFIRRVHKNHVGPELSAQIKACRDYIDLHLEEELTLERLSQRVGYTKSHLSRRFKQEVHASISEYIRYARIERAKTLLSYSELPITEIAERMQFCSSSHFSEVFRAVTGELPQQYRSRTRKL